MPNDAHNRATVKYNRTMDSITVRPDKDTGARIRAAASVAGQPLQRYVLDAVLSRMEQESKGRE